MKQLPHCALQSCHHAHLPGLSQYLMVAAAGVRSSSANALASSSHSAEDMACGPGEGWRGSGGVPESEGRRRRRWQQV